jgi:hypothetical protein
MTYDNPQNYSTILKRQPGCCARLLTHSRTTDPYVKARREVRQAPSAASVL